MKTLLVAAALALSASVPRAQTIPAGTALPVRLNTGLSSTKSKAGQRITARLMQDVPLPRGRVLHEGSKVVGHVVRVTRAGSGAEAEIAFRFDGLRVSKTTVPLTTDLRALASFMEIQDAQDPAMGADRGTAPAAYTTVQVGGDVVYRGGGPVMSGGDVVGTPVPDGVLVRLRANPGEGCRGAFDGNDRPQALWLFSSDACGAYGLPLVKIRRAGRSDPLGEIVLTSREGDVNVHRGTGMLLRVLGETK